MSLFKRNPTDALARQRALLAADEQKIAGLQRDRAAALIETEGVAEIEDIDARIGALRRACSIHRDRIEALQVQVRAETAERRERAREAAIKVIQKRLAAREALAVELETAIKRVGEAFFALLNAPSVAADWPFGPLPGLANIDISTIRKETGWALFAAGKPTGGRTILPGPTNVGLGVTGVHAIGLVATVADRSSSLLSLLREIPLGEADAADDAPAENVPEPHGLAGLATL